MSKATILIIEDDGILTLHLREIISRLGYTVAGSLASGEEAIAFLTQNPVDLVLMDIELAGDMNGIATAEVLHKTSDIPVIFLTGFSQDPLLEQAKQAAPYGYLIKPVSERELAAAAEMTLHRHMLDRKLKESRLALQKSEAQYRQLFEHAPVGIFKTTLDGKALAANAEMARIYGCESPEKTASEFTDLAHQFYVDPERRKKFISLLRDQGSVRSFEYEARKKNGETVWISMDARLTSDENREDGEPIIDGFAMDITKRKRADDALRASEEHLRLALEAAHAGTWEWNLDTGENIWSKELWKFYGLDPEDITPRHEIWLQTIHPEDRESVEQSLQQAISEKTEVNLEWRVNLADGEVSWLMSRGKPSFDSSGRITRYQGIVLDITKQKRIEEERKILQSQLAQAQKMEAIGTLAGGIAHDFNNILSAIIGYAELARDDCPPESQIAGDLNEVILAGSRARDLVKQILAFSRQTDNKPILLQPATIVKETIKMLRSSLPSTITIHHDINADAGLILADPTQIHQILMNLCTNAFHAMEETGGSLSISLKKSNGRGNGVDSDLPPGNYIELTVQDNGCGIAPEIHKKIFDPYFTTKDTGRGTGMGLAIVHGIVKSYGGSITCESAVGKGTIFTIALPVVEKETASEAKPSESAPEGSEHILFIDDEMILVEMTRSMLERLGYTVTVRTSSLEALNTFKNHPDAFDLVITDQTMPGMTGFDLARMMLQIRPNLPVILCTGYSSTISEEKARSAGILGFALKPLTKKDISSLIRKVLHNLQS